MARQVLQRDKRALMLTQTPGKLMMSLSLPAIVGMAVIGLYTFMDAVYAGQLIGMEAMGAVAVAYPFTFINSGGASMIGMGSASVLSRAIGAKDQRTIDQVMGNLVVMNLVLSLTVTIVGTVFARPLLALTGAQGQVLDLAESYLRIMLVGSLFVNFAQSSNMVMRGKGELARAMAIMGGGAVLNMVLAPLFILALRDQGLGIQGAGCATVITQMIQAGVMLWWFVKREKTARIVRVAVSPAILPEVLKVGASAMLMQVLVLVQQAIAYRAAAAWGGAEWQVLLGAALRIQAFAFIPLWGMSNGLQPAAGTNYGAGLYGRVRKLTIVFCLGSMALALLFCTRDAGAGSHAVAARLRPGRRRDGRRRFQGVLLHLPGCRPHGHGHHALASARTRRQGGDPHVRATRGSVRPTRADPAERRRARHPRRMGRIGPVRRRHDRGGGVHGGKRDPQPGKGRRLRS